MLAQPSGTLRASMPVDFATTYMVPPIAEFASRYPGITFDFDLTPWRVDLVTEPFDVVIRMGEPTESSLIARLLARLSVQAYASPRYLDHSGEPSHPTDLTRHECLSGSAFPKQENGCSSEARKLSRLMSAGGFRSTALACSDGWRRCTGCGASPCRGGRRGFGGGSPAKNSA